MRPSALYPQVKSGDRDPRLCKHPNSMNELCGLWPNRKKRSCSLLNRQLWSGGKIEMLHYKPLQCKRSAKDSQMDHNDALGLVGWPRIVSHTIQYNTYCIVGWPRIPKGDDWPPLADHTLRVNLDSRHLLLHFRLSFAISMVITDVHIAHIAKMIFLGFVIRLFFSIWAILYNFNDVDDDVTDWIWCSNIPINWALSGGILCNFRHWDLLIWRCWTRNLFYPPSTLAFSSGFTRNPKWEGLAPPHQQSC